MSKKNKRWQDPLGEFVKANRRGEYQARSENNPGFKSKDRAHKNYTKYSRKNSINNLNFSEE